MDRTLLECRRGNDFIGLTDCGHAQDVWLECIDTRECDVNNGGCEHICNETIGSFICSCFSGYSLNSNLRNCSNINECSESLDNCDGNATCSDTEGSFDCTCNQGYFGNGVLGNCSDIDECDDPESNNCHNNATCINTEGGFRCVCLNGFTGNGFNCSDNNECEEGSHNCHDYANCTNSVGGFQCSCLQGFVGDGILNCSNIDECSEDMPCHPNATCIDSLGSYDCFCNAGFSGDGLLCEDIDECVMDNGNCSQLCNNSVGSYDCSCTTGYILDSDGMSCNDIDECTSNLSICMNNSQCVNTIGSYQCDCNSGYEGNGFSLCTNINECNISTHNCDINADCIDTIGSFKCVCHHGYFKNGSFCDCMNGNVRLMNGSVPSLGEGRVEVCYNRIYGTVCDDLWNEKAAAVVCAMVNASYGAPIRGRDSIYGAGMGPIVLDNLVCEGTESNLLDCNHSDIKVHNCDHREDAAVMCGITCVEGSVRLGNNDITLRTQEPPQVFIKDEISRGRVEVCQNDSFGTVCDNSWDSQDSSVVCRQLGFSPYGALPVDRRFYFESSLMTALSSINCSGSERALAECSSMMSQTCPEQQTDAGVVCQDISVERSNCSTGDVRLVNGTNSLEGRVEICLNSAWGTVCDRDFTEDVASIICRQLNHMTNGTIAHRESFFGQGSGPIFLEQFRCRPDSATLLDCAQPPLGIHFCDHSMDAGVTCRDFNECVINNGGCEHSCVNTIPSFSCFCNDGYVLDENGRNCSDIDECAMDPCHPNATCTNTEGSFNCTCQSNFKGNGTTCTMMCQNGFELNNSVCTCVTGEVRVGQDVALSEGQVEVCVNNTYGAVCDDFWDTLDAQVVCQQLGFSNESQALLDQPLVSTVYLDNVQCTGSEMSLLSCSANILGEHNCQPNDGAGVRCAAVCSDGDVRICTGTNNRDCFVSTTQQYLIDDRLSVGRVEVCSGGRYGTICDDVWTNQAASVVCRQLGFSPYGAIALMNRFSDGNVPVLVTFLNCSGEEQRLYNCSVNTGASASCGRFEDAGIVCQRDNTTRDNCTTGSVRLADMITTNTTAEGRVEVCINQAWGTVCNRRFDSDDAGTVCVLAGGYLRSASAVIPLETSTTVYDRPIFLENLDCRSSDTDILQCYSFSTTPGITSCTHSQDVGVRCTDINECDSERGGCEQVCTNTVGSFFCSCNQGFVLADKFNCTDIDECTIEGPERHDCHVNATCTNTIGSFNCTCNPGYIGNGTFCENVDECAEGTDDCHRETNATCTDTVGSYVCSCSEGYTGNGTFCTDIDECLNTTICHPNADCTNNDGSFVCICSSGYSGDGFQCVDIDECAMNLDNCDFENGTCQNINGSFQCFCNVGYTGNGINCSNINECEEGLDICAINATCADTLGNYTCSCNSGFSGNGFTCSDINECEVSGMACDREADCFNSIGSFTCQCRAGFTGNGSFCEDINECDLMKDDCNSNSNCSNTVGSFICICSMGFSGNGRGDNCTCRDGDVLLMNGRFPSVPQTEGRVEVCYNNTYHSICDDLWDEIDARVVCRQLGANATEHFAMKRSSSRFGAGSGAILLDNIMCSGNENNLLECIHNPLMEVNCDHTEDAGVVCGVTCEDGYVQLVGDESSVRIKDEISQGAVEICINGSFRSVCDSGWDNLDASVLCSEIGFSRFGAVGLQGNVFVSSFDREKANVSCLGEELRIQDCNSSNVSPTFACDIASAVCQDVNTAVSNCSDGNIRLVNGATSHEGRLEVCVNRVFGTVCQVGFSSDEATVVCRNLGLYNESLLRAIEGSPDAETSGTFGEGEGPIFLSQLNCAAMDADILNCPRGGTNLGITPCSHSQDVGVRCPDVNECLLGVCNDIFANCHNTVGSFFCACKDGYVGNGTVCEDINECNMNNGNCSNICENTVGSFSCSCGDIDKYEIGPDTKTCIDINECERGTHNCSEDRKEVCMNTNGSFLCVCAPGYNLTNGECEDINECNVSGACINGECRNSDGNYTCDCNDGFESLNFSTCIDIDECSRDFHDCDPLAECSNLDGGFTCTCRPGFTGNGSLSFCEDVDECENITTTDCHPNSLCQNTNGSYECQCFPGYVGDGRTCNCTDGDSRIVRSDGSTTSVLAFNPFNYSESCYSVIRNATVTNFTCSTVWSGIIEGRVEVCQNRTFGTVCDNRWDTFEAQVVCRQLGANSEDVLAVRRSSRFFGAASNIDIFLTDLRCTGSESNLFKCSSRRPTTCDHSEDAGVRCGATCEDYQSRIIIGDSEEDYYNNMGLNNMEDIDMTYFVDNELAVGRIELCLNGTWSPVCEDVWSNTDASVACHQLGFSRAGAISGNQRFQISSAPENVQLIQRNFSCNGSESNLQDCLSFFSVNGVSQCEDIRRNAYIVCQSPMVLPESCEDGAIRLFNGSTVREGLVQVCINQAWGTVCSEQFSITDAQVVCSQMNFERMDATRIVEHGVSIDDITPIFISNLGCSDSDTNILECRRGDLGITTCRHSDDVYVRCRAFCSMEMEVVSHGSYNWPRIEAERTKTMNCEFGGFIQGVPNQLARRRCSERGEWYPTNFSECASYTMSLLRNTSSVNITEGTISTVSLSLYDAVILANASEDQSSSNLMSISSNLERIRNDCGVSNEMCSITSNVLKNLTNMVDALQSWNDQVLESGSAGVVNLVEAILEDFTQETTADNVSITSQSGTVSYTSFKREQQNLVERGVTYGIQRDEDSEIQLLNSVMTNISAASFNSTFSGILLPPDIFKNHTNGSVGIVFGSYNSSRLFPLLNQAIDTFAVASSLVSATIIGNDSEFQSSSVYVVLQLEFELSQAERCVFWDTNAAGGNGNWSDRGCKNISRHLRTIVCECNHLSTFGVLVNTAPVQCPEGFLPDVTVTECIAQKPEVTISSSLIEVLTGRSVKVLCNSSGDYRGNVTWRRGGEAVPEVQLGGDNQQVLNEVAGQLYAFRMSEHEVYLQTRDDETLGAAVGIGEHAGGLYVCEARNTNESEMVTLNVTVITPVEENLEYVRFSTNVTLFSDVTLAGFQTIILNSLGDLNKEFVKCTEVPRRPQGKMYRRVACQVSSTTSGVLASSLTRLINKETVFKMFDFTKVSDQGFCDYETFVTPDSRGTYQFSETEANKTVGRPCELGNQTLGVQGQIQRTCLSDRNWVEYDGQECASEALVSLRRNVQQVTADNAEEVIDIVSDAVSELNDDEQSSENLGLVTTALDSITELVTTGQLVVTVNITSSTTDVMSAVSEWPEDAVEQNASSLVGSFEDIISGYISQNDSAPFSRVTSQIQVNASVLSDTDEGLSLSSDFGSAAENFTDELEYIPAQIMIPPSVFDNRTNIPFVQTAYSTPIFFPLLREENDTDTVVDSDVLGFSIVNMNVTNSEDPIIILLQSKRLREGMNIYDPVCASWDFDVIDPITKSVRGNWTSRGCVMNEINSSTGVINCSCNHLTNFAVLVNINAPPPNPIVEATLKYLTIIGSVLSMIGLLLTVFTMLFFKKLRQRDASKFHAQLCIALFLMLLTFVAGIEQTQNEYACTVISFLIQYFTLAAAFWMGAEAVLMFKKLIIVFGRTSGVFIGVVSVICWVAPLLFPIIGLTTLFTGENYLIADTFCFLSDNRIRGGIFLAPLFSIIVFNVIVCVMVVRVLVKHSKKKILDAKNEKDRKKLISSTLKTMLSIVSVMLMFGLSWLFGAFSVSGAAVVFQWLFVIFSTSQGLMLFIFFCVIGQDAREEWKKLLSCYRYSPTKKGATPSSVSYAGRAPRSYVTKESSLSTRATNSRTMRISAGLVSKDAKSDLNDNMAPLEMSSFNLDQVKENLSSNEFNIDSFEKHNGQSNDGYQVHDTQLPPQILFRLRRPHYDVIADESDTNGSLHSSASSQINDEKIEMETTICNGGFSDSGASACGSDIEYSEL